jgi:hypothetical protein
MSGHILAHPPVLEVDHRDTSRILGYRGTYPYGGRSRHFPDYGFSFGAVAHCDELFPQWSAQFGVLLLQALTDLKPSFGRCDAFFDELEDFGRDERHFVQV